MKILTLLPQTGLWGAPLAGLRTARALARLGAEQVFCLGGEGPLEELVRKEGFPVHHVSARSKAPARVLGALALLHKTRPRLVHAHGLLGLSRDFALAARILGIPLAWHLHEDLTFPRYRKRLGSVRTLASLALAVSRVQLPHLGGVRALHLPNAVDPAAFPPPAREDRERARRELGIEPDRFVVLALGRISPDKGSILLARALEEAASREPRILGLFAGGGKRDDLRLLEERLQGRERDLGRILPPRPEVLPLLHGADLLVLPSRRENCPLVVLEALATGLPVLATPVGDLPRLLAGGKGGRLLPPQPMLDPATLAGFLLRAARGEGPAREAEGARGREAVLADHDLGAQAARLQQIFETLTGSTMEERRP